MSENQAPFTIRVKSESGKLSDTLVTVGDTDLPLIATAINLSLTNDGRLWNASVELPMPRIDVIARVAAGQIDDYRQRIVSWRLALDSLERQLDALEGTTTDGTSDQEAG